MPTLFFSPSPGLIHKLYRGSPPHSGADLHRHAQPALVPLEPHRPTATSDAGNTSIDWEAMAHCSIPLAMATSVNGCDCYKLLYEETGRVVYSDGVTWNPPEVPWIIRCGFHTVPKPVSVDGKPAPVRQLHFSAPTAPAPTPPALTPIIATLSMPSVPQPPPLPTALKPLLQSLRASHASCYTRDIRCRGGHAGNLLLCTRHHGNFLLR